MKHFLPLALTAAISLSLTPASLALANEAASTLDQEIATASEPEYIDPGLQIEEMIQNFETEGVGRILRERAERGELFYTSAQAAVQLKPESRDWGNARVMAYKEAMLKAQAKYIEQLGVTAAAESVSRLFDDKSQMPSFTEQELRSSNKLMELLDKAVAVAGGMLDEQLQELGIDPEEYAAATPEKRAQLFERSVSETVSLKARQSLTGIMPVKTFEAYDANGNHVVAVVIVASDKARQFVSDITRSKGDMAPTPEKASQESLLQRLRSDKKALINEFGIRRMYDENGYPVLVSFGQSSNPYKGEDYQQRADNRELAYAAAKADAYANFAYLFNSTGSSSQETSRKMINQRVGIVRKEKEGISETEESTLDFIQAINREISARGRVNNLPGTRELFRWTTKHPVYNQEINGVVYVWHPVAEANARKMRNFKPKANSSSGQVKQAQASRSGNAGSSESRNLIRADDF